MKQVRRVLRELDAGHLEYKKRGVPADWLNRLKRLKTTGSRPLTAVVFPFAGQVKVALCERVHEGAG